MEICEIYDLSFEHNWDMFQNVFSFSGISNTSNVYIYYLYLIFIYIYLYLIFIYNLYYCSGTSTSYIDNFLFYQFLKIFTFFDF